MQDAVVIGAGLAGAAAALRLGDAGKSVTIVEARGRLGGRTYTRPGAGSPDLLEFGGGWITDWHDRMKALVARFGLDLRPAMQITERRWHDGQSLRRDTPVSADDMPDWTAAMARIRADSLAMLGGAGRFEGGNPWASVSLAEYMQARDLPKAVQREFIAWWTISGSGDITRVNALDALHCAAIKGGALEGIYEELSHTVEGGVGTLTERMIAGSGAQVIKGDAVVEVTDHADRVTLRLSSGALFTAHQAVVAVPVNAVRTMRFDPPLRPAQSRLAAEGHHGRALKMMMRVQGVKPGVLVTGDAGGLRLMLSDHLLSDGTALVIGFGLYDEMSDTSFDAMSRAVNAFFPEGRLLAHDWHDWIRDPWSAGTWVSHGLGQSALYEGTEWAAKGRLNFASSDIAPRESGWFEGAVLAGEQAAEAVLSQLRG